MGKWVHRMSSIDEGDMTGICAHCGPVSVIKRPSSSRYICRIGEREKKRKYKRSKHHGLLGHEALAMKTGASCEICGSVDRLVIDHRHSDGLIRGVLCHWCNIALGMMRDDPQRLRSAASYLEK